MDASFLIQMLGLAPLPEEGGYFRETYRSEHSTAILYLLDEHSVSRFHRLAHDEIWHFHLGGPVELWRLCKETGASEMVVLGPDIGAGQLPQALVRAGTWQGARLVRGVGFALLSCTVSPPYTAAIRQMASREELLRAFPDCRDVVWELT